MSISILGEICLQFYVSKIFTEKQSCFGLINILMKLKSLPQCLKTIEPSRWRQFSLSGRRRRSDRECILHRIVTWPSTQHLCLGTATRPSTLTFDPSRVQPWVGSHAHTHTVQVQRAVNDSAAAASTQYTIKHNKCDNFN